MEKPAAKPEAPFGSNAIRLSPREWAVAAALTLACFLFIPRLWERLEPFAPGPDYRTPYTLSNDYWRYARYCRAAVAAGKTLVVGDSVIWGQYVEADQTLSHYLNALSGDGRFANMGMDGMHPAALAGLMEYYGTAVSGRKVVLHCNLLWMSSEQADLQTDKEFRFNHPKLVPQFHPRIRCYTEPVTSRLGVVAERYIAFLAWTDHLRVAYCGSSDIPAWTMEHPYWPVKREPPAEEKHRRKPRLWTGKEREKQDFSWVKLETSFQWRSFRRAVRLLQGRGNTVFVLVGPFNEHMVKASSLGAYRELKSGIEEWLQKNHVPYGVPPVLPSEQYADASHPLAPGYELLAKEVFENEGFRSHILGR